MDPFAPDLTASASTEAITSAQRQAHAHRLIEEANSLRATPLIQRSVALYQAAIDQLQHDDVASEAASYRDALASAWTNLGITWLMIGTSESLRDAVECFDRAIALREPLLNSRDPWSEYNLAGVYLNRGDVFARSGASLGLIIANYDRAIEVLRNSLPSTSPLFYSRLALAWFNRGKTLARAKSDQTRSEIMRALGEAIRIAESCPEKPPVARLLPAAWSAKADALSEVGSTHEAWSAALRAIELLKPIENENAESAVLSLRSRITLCYLATQFLTPTSPRDNRRQKLAAAMDAAKAGLALAKRWEGEPRLEPLTRRLFEVAAETCAVLEPQFLVEFLDENLPAIEEKGAPDDARKVAAHALTTGLAQLAREAFTNIGKAECEGILANFRQLRQASTRLEIVKSSQPMEAE